jgi:chemotaxis protein MotB
MATGNDRPIIIKKKKKVAGHGHHGGAWKVAYADFVTAMMAFFLLLWLLNVTTDEQRAGIADYFDPASVARATSGAGGVLGGATLTSPGSQVSPSARASLQQSRPGRREPVPDAQWHDENQTDEIIPEGDAATNEAGGGTGNNADGRQGPDDAPRTFALGGDGTGVEGEPTDATGTAEAGTDPAGAAGFAAGTEGGREGAAGGGPPSAAQLAEALARAEQQAFEETEAELRQAIQELPELQQLAQSLVIEQTPEGLRIQIVDQERYAMFPSGSALPYGYTEELIGLIARVVGALPNGISITGHTDATPFAAGAGTDNWELSADRANASRRALVDAGLDPSRIETVVGRADTDPLFVDDPSSPRNRRISITLLREAPLAATN